MPNLVPSTPSRRIALAHHWLMSMRGGEKTLSAMAELFPESPIYTLLANHDQLDATLRSRDIRCSWLQRYNRIPNLQRKAMPLLVRAAESLDATGYDAVICSDAAIIKAIRTGPQALKICYCYSPMRYVWDLYDDYRRQAGLVSRLGLRLFAPGLREADRKFAQDVDVFIAISEHVADRIRRHYGRESVILYPPVNVESPPPVEKPDSFFLVLSELVPYKRVDLAVDACTRLNRQLVVIGTGPRMSDLRRRAGKTVRLLGWQDDATVRDHLRRCRALLFCGEEDFGLTPVEAMAAGRPVIALRRGGATETVLEDRTGVFFDEPTVNSLIEAIQSFEAHDVSWTPDQLQEHAAQFSKERFCRQIADLIDACLEQHKQGGREQVRRWIKEAGPATVNERLTM